MEVFGVKTDKMAINYNYRLQGALKRERPLLTSLKINLFAWQIDENTQLVTFIEFFFANENI